MEREAASEGEAESRSGLDHQKVAGTAKFADVDERAYVNSMKPRKRSGHPILRVSQDTSVPERRVGCIAGPRNSRASRTQPLSRAAVAAVLRNDLAGGPHAVHRSSGASDRTENRPLILARKNTIYTSGITDRCREALKTLRSAPEGSCVPCGATAFCSLVGRNQDGKSLVPQPAEEQRRRLSKDPCWAQEALWNMGQQGSSRISVSLNGS